MQDNMYVKIYHNNTGQCFKDILMQEYMYVKNIPQRNRSMVQRHSNARVHKCKKLNVTSTVESFNFLGGRLSWICGFLLIPRGRNSVNAPVFSFSNKVNSFLVCFHRRCKLFGEMLPKNTKSYH